MTKRKIDVDESTGRQLEAAILRAMSSLKGETFGDFQIDDMRLAEDDSSIWCVVHSADDQYTKDHFEIFVEFVRRLEDLDDEEFVEDDDCSEDDFDEEFEDDLVLKSAT